MPFVVTRVSSKTFPVAPVISVNPHLTGTAAGTSTATAALGIGSSQPFVQENTATFFIQTNTVNNDIQVDV